MYNYIKKKDYHNLFYSNLLILFQQSLHNPSFYFIIRKGIVIILKFYTIDIDYIKYLYSFDTEVYFNKKDMIMKINLILVQLFSMMKFHISFL